MLRFVHLARYRTSLILLINRLLCESEVIVYLMKIRYYKIVLQRFYRQKIDSNETTDDERLTVVEEDEGSKIDENYIDL